MKPVRTTILILALIFGSLIFKSSSCIQCDDILALCDLTIKTFQAPNEVSVGEIFDLTTRILNDEQSGSCSATEIANTTFNLVEVFLKDDLGNWDLVGSKSNISQGEIYPGDILELIEDIILNLAGDYRFDYYDDVVGYVDERDEDNNYDFIYEGYRVKDLKPYLKGSNNFASVYVRVNPAADGTTLIAGKEIVEFQ